MTAGVLPADVRPDSIVVVRSMRGSAVLCLEIDEATEHSPTIRARLARVRAGAGRSRGGWHAALGRADRGAAGLAPPGRPLGRSGPGSKAARGDSSSTTFGPLGLRAPTHPVGWSGEAVPFEALVADPRPRRCPTPVGSSGWIRLLGTGGAEETDEALQ